MFLNSIKICLEEQPEIELVGLLESGEACLEFADKNAIDVVIMDAHMPSMDGIQATQELKKKYPKIKVILCTVWDEAKAKVYAKKAGADSYFLKGKFYAELIDKIKELA
jgi:DNA-binding NarL/FixJ family response regulator